MNSASEPLRTFYRSLMGEGAGPLPYKHRYYVEMFPDDPVRDPIRRLMQRIDLAESESVNLLTKPLEISDFILSLCAALAAEVESDNKRLFRSPVASKSDSRSPCEAMPYSPTASPHT